MESIPVDARTKPFGVCSTKGQDQLLRESPKTGLKGISKNIFIKPTASKPAPPVQKFLVSSRLKIDFRPIAESVVLAGRLRHFLPNWEQITGDPAILDVVQGYQLEFLAPPRQGRIRQPLQFSRGVGQHRLRGCHPPGKRSVEYGQAGFRPVSKQLIFSPQAGREIPPGYQSKGVECISSVRSFQNGGHSPSARFTSASRLAGKNRFERCILRSSDLERSQEIPSIHLEGLPPRVCLPPLWPVGVSEIVHKTFKAGGFSSSPNRNTSDNISGRSLVYEPVQRGSRAGYGHRAVSTGKSRFRDQSREVLLRPKTKIGVSGLCSGHSGYDSAPARLQSGVNQIPLQRSVGASRGLRPGSLPIDWEVDGVYTSNIPCPFALPSPPASETPGFSPTKELRFHNTSIERGQGGATLVAGPPERLERSCASASPSRYSNRNGRIEDGLRGSLPRSTNRGVVVSDGEKASHQLLGAPSRILCCEELHKEPLTCPCEAAHGQHFGRGVCKSSRGDSFPSFVQPGSGSVGMGTQSGFLSQCRAPIGASEYNGGLAISALPGLEQLEVMPRSVSRSDVNSRAMYQGPLRGPAKCTAASVFQLETGSPRAGLGCASTGLVEREELCFSSLLPDNAISSEVEGTGRRVGVSNPCLAHESVVPYLAGPVRVPSGPFTNESESLTRSSGAGASPDCEPDVVPRRVACIKQSLQSEGICADASKLILAAWRPGTNAVYNSAWEKWHSWCLSRESD